MSAMRQPQVEAVDGVGLDVEERLCFLRRACEDFDRELEAVGESLLLAVVVCLVDVALAQYNPRIVERRVERHEAQQLSLDPPVLDSRPPGQQLASQPRDVRHGSVALEEEEADGDVTADGKQAEVESPRAVVHVFRLQVEDPVRFAVVEDEVGPVEHKERDLARLLLPSRRRAQLHALEEEDARGQEVDLSVVGQQLLQVSQVSLLARRVHALHAPVRLRGLRPPVREVAHRLLRRAAGPRPHHHGRHEGAGSSLAPAAVDRKDVLLARVEPARGSLAVLEEDLERRGVVVEHRQLLHLPVEEGGVVVAVARLLEVLAQVHHHKAPEVPRGEELGHVPHVVAVHGAVDAGEGHGEEAVADVGQVQVEVHVRVDEPPLRPAAVEGRERPQELQHQVQASEHVQLGRGDFLELAIHPRCHAAAAVEGEDDAGEDEDEEVPEVEALGDEAGSGGTVDPSPREVWLEDDGNDVAEVKEDEEDDEGDVPPVQPRLLPVDPAQEVAGPSDLEDEEADEVGDGDADDPADAEVEPEVRLGADLLPHVRVKLPLIHLLLCERRGREGEGRGRRERAMRGGRRGRESGKVERQEGGRIKESRDVGTSSASFFPESSAPDPLNALLFLQDVGILIDPLSLIERWSCRCSMGVDSCNEQ
eukprot:434861-Hanusia_phi.AAC.6